MYNFLYVCIRGIEEKQMIPGCYFVGYAITKHFKQFKHTHVDFRKKQSYVLDNYDNVNRNDWIFVWIPGYIPLISLPSILEPNIRCRPATLLPIIFHSDYDFK